ncbi:AMP-binding protein [Frigoriflavimonas asaccharolytica]|uniref:O-succinylbenzoic acid--CoA ligase n=1 Tax=Frigoriflavimonas asaccharolytica TaxID=2735899 RepID=A0A8J8K535_9FLAO|nr:AMP-binding protein [Frigoriflavimonas asaccharolytica]NRS92400.1 O-succinylbenzoic acid--CoA ligase [Frigoriflavimonas asaccharolytica]
MTIDFNNFNINTLYPKTDFESDVIFFLKDWFSASNTVEIQSSGSTGAPKRFEIEKQKMRNSAKMTCDFLLLDQDCTALLCLPIKYISGKMMVVRAIESKMKLIISTPSSRPLQNIEHNVDFCAMTPLQVEHSLDSLSLMKNLIIGGAQVSENLKQKINSILKIENADSKIFETYGMSETLSHIALKQIYPVEDKYFTVLDGIKISQNENSCLKIDAPKLNSEILQTSDIVHIVDKKRFEFLGRADFVINSGGVKIFPEILENFLKKNGIEKELIYAGIEDEILGQKLVLFIEGEEDSQMKNNVNNIPFEQKFHRPKEIVFLKQFPRSENGKILRKDVVFKNLK